MPPPARPLKRKAFAEAEDEPAEDKPAEEKPAWAGRAKRARPTESGGVAGAPSGTQIQVKCCLNQCFSCYSTILGVSRQPRGGGASATAVAPGGSSFLFESAAGFFSGPAFWRQSALVFVLVDLAAGSGPDPGFLDSVL